MYPRIRSRALTLTSRRRKRRFDEAGVFRKKKKKKKKTPKKNKKKLAGGQIWRLRADEAGGVICPWCDLGRGVHARGRSIQRSCGGKSRFKVEKMADSIGDLQPGCAHAAGGHSRDGRAARDRGLGLGSALRRGKGKTSEKNGGKKDERGEKERKRKRETRGKAV